MTTTENKESEALENSSDVVRWLGGVFDGCSIWLTVSNGGQPHDKGESSNAAVLAFFRRTGIPWEDAIDLGWRVVRARTKYTVTAELIESVPPNNN